MAVRIFSNKHVPKIEEEYDQFQAEDNLLQHFVWTKNAAFEHRIEFPHFDETRVRFIETSDDFDVPKYPQDNAIVG